MLIERRALEVSRLCLPPDEDVAPVATHVFIDEAANVTATDGHCLLQIDSTPTQEPNLFMSELPTAKDKIEAMTLPGDIVADFLKAWAGEHVVLTSENGSVKLASADGQASRLFEVRGDTVTAPAFTRMLKPNPATAAVVTLNVKTLKKFLDTMKALGAETITLHVVGGVDENAHMIRVTGKTKDDAREIVGALMPMRM